MSLDRILATAILSATALGGAPVGAATLNVVTAYAPAGETVRLFDGRDARTGEITARQMDLFGMAGRFWESVLTGFAGKGDLTFGVTATMASFDGPYGVAAYAGQTGLEYVRGEDPATGDRRDLWRTTGGFVMLDADDFAAGGTLHSEDTFLAVAVHEIGHTLGFGLLFEANGLKAEGVDTYVGREAVAAFNLTHGTAVSGIALDLGGGHWSECWTASLRGVACDPDRDGDAEVMTPILAQRGVTLAPATIAAFRDLGYVTIDPFAAAPLPDAQAAAPVPAVPLPAAGLLLLAGIGGLHALRGARRT